LWIKVFVKIAELVGTLADEEANELTMTSGTKYRPEAIGNDASKPSRYPIPDDDHGISAMRAAGGRPDCGSAGDAVGLGLMQRVTMPADLDLECCSLLIRSGDTPFHRRFRSGGRRTRLHRVARTAARRRRGERGIPTIW
jgi:hypothetical protein